MYKNNLDTMSGMWAVWDYNTYEHIDDYDKWEPLFCEDNDIIRQIEKSTFAPICIFEDGCRSFVVKIDEDLSDREQKYVCVKSEPYFLNCSGRLIVSGVEHIGADINQEHSISIDLPAGNYSIRVFLLSWDDEPGALLDNGKISPDALSDFVVLINSNAPADAAYRKRLNTFSEDDNN